jgi:hypothetical protein
MRACCLLMRLLFHHYANARLFALVYPVTPATMPPVALTCGYYNTACLQQGVCLCLSMPDCMLKPTAVEPGMG